MITIASVAAQGGAAGSTTAPGTAVGATGALAQQMEL
jgi:hypothetical protein